MNGQAYYLVDEENDEPYEERNAIPAARRSENADASSRGLRGGGVGKGEEKSGVHRAAEQGPGSCGGRARGLEILQQGMESAALSCGAVMALLLSMRKFQVH